MSDFAGIPVHKWIVLVFVVAMLVVLFVVVPDHDEEDGPMPLVEMFVGGLTVVVTGCVMFAMAVVDFLFG